MNLDFTQTAPPECIIVADGYLFHNRDARDGIVLEDYGAKKLQKDLFVTEVKINEEDSKDAAADILVFSTDTYPIWIRPKIRIDVYLGYQGTPRRYGPYRVKDVDPLRKSGDGFYFNLSATKSGSLRDNVVRKVHDSGSYLTLVTSIVERYGKTLLLDDTAKSLLAGKKIDSSFPVVQSELSDMALLGQLLRTLDLRYIDARDTLSITGYTTTNEDLWELDYLIGRKNVKQLSMKFKERSPGRPRNRDRDHDALAECQAELEALRNGTIPEEIDIDNLTTVLDDFDPEKIVDDIAARASESMTDIDVDKVVAAFDPERPFGSLIDAATTVLMPKEITEGIQNDLEASIETLNFNQATGEMEAQLQSIIERVTGDHTPATEVNFTDDTSVSATVYGEGVGINGRKSKVSKHLVTAELMFGNTQMSLADKVKLKGAKYPFDGQYRVKAIKHSYSKSGFNTSVDMEMFYKLAASTSSADEVNMSLLPDEEILYTPVPNNLPSRPLGVRFDAELGLILDDFRED